MFEINAKHHVEYKPIGTAALVSIMIQTVESRSIFQEIL